MCDRNRLFVFSVSRCALLAVRGGFYSSLQVGSAASLEAAKQPGCASYSVSAKYMRSIGSEDWGHVWERFEGFNHWVAVGVNVDSGDNGVLNVLGIGWRRGECT